MSVNRPQLRRYIIKPHINHKEEQVDKPTRQEYQLDALQLTTKTKPFINANPLYSCRQLNADLSTRACCHNIVLSFGVERSGFCQEETEAIGWILKFP